MSNTMESILKFIGAFESNPIPELPWKQMCNTSPTKEQQVHEVKPMPMTCGGILRGVNGCTLQPYVVDLTKELRTQFADGIWGPSYCGSVIERLISFLVANKNVLHKIINGRFLMAPIGKPCGCKSRQCKGTIPCNKTSLPNLTFLIGTLKNLHGNLDYYWVNPIQILFKQTEDVECTSNLRTFEMALKLTNKVKIGDKYPDPFVMNFARGRIEENPQLLAALGRAGFSRNSFCDVQLDALSTIHKSRELEPWIGLFAQLMDSRVRYEAKEGYAKVTLILDLHSATALFFPAICHAMGLLPDLQLLCLYQGCYTPSMKLKELFAPLKLST